MPLNLYVVVLRDFRGDIRCASCGVTRSVLSYQSLEDAMSAAQRYIKRHKKVIRDYGYRVRVIPFSAEGELIDIWADYKHTEVT